MDDNQTTNTTLMLSNYGRAALPLELAYLMPSGTQAEYVARIFCVGIVSSLGVITNTLSACVLIKGKLVKNWTYGMILNLTVTDWMLCLASICLRLPAVAIGK